MEIRFLTKAITAFVCLMSCSAVLVPTRCWTQDRVEASGLPSKQVPNWPRFRGPNGRGIAESGSYPAHLGIKKNLLWKVPIPSGVSSPIVWGNYLVVTGFDSLAEKLKTILLDRQSGHILWTRRAPAEQIETVHDVSSPANATPATDGRRVYAYFGSNGLFCYDFDGNELWNVRLPIRSSEGGNGSSPIVVNQMVILNRDEYVGMERSGAGKWVRKKGDAHLLAVRCSDGQPVWKAPRPGDGSSYTTPVVWNNVYGAQVILLGGKQAAGYALATGEQLWWVDGVPPQACASPFIDGDHIYVTATGMFGEPEAFVGVPQYEGFLKNHDTNNDGRLSLSEIPEDVLVADRRADGGEGNKSLLRFAHTADRDRNKHISKEEWGGLRSFAKNRITAKPGLYSIRLGGVGNVTETHVDWIERKGATEVSTPLLYRGRLYLVRNGGIVHCRSPQNGKHHFRGRLGPIGAYYASPVAGDGKIYFTSERGVITVLASDDSLRILARNDLGERIMGTPALVEGKIYVRTDKHLMAFGNSM